MLGPTSPRRLLPSSTRNSLAALGFLIVSLAGCRGRSPGGIVPSAGYVRLPTLIRIHPAWSDVERLNGLIAKPIQVEQQQSHGFAAPAIASPPSLAAPPPIKREDAGAEGSRLTAIKEAAHSRINKLQNTLNQRTARIIQRRQREAQNQAVVELQNETQRLKDEAASRKAARRSSAHAPVRDLGLQEIAFVSQLNSLSKFPGGGGSARQDVEGKLASVRIRKKSLEDALATDLAGIDKQLATDLAAADHRIQVATAGKVDQLRKAEEERQADTNRRNLNEVDVILSTLAPLGTSPAPVISVVTPMALSAPSSVTMPARLPADPTADAASAKDRQILAGQRDKMVQFITDDIKRRLTRLAAQQRWDLTFLPGPGRGDFTERAADLLRDEWKP